jgi:hypothetical protein
MSASASFSIFRQDNVSNISLFLCLRSRKSVKIHIHIIYEIQCVSV